ncbi:protein-export chaperone SecB [Halonatronum saccharophilum]|uniref:protein-export chaperone SecB n=1 Tax=Halonatronum saccharophilum TaxID=150060 RepID=UPI0004B30C86|nr:protein-export chaperone SecB [Halonatronum saccharophilum]
MNKEFLSNFYFDDYSIDDIEFNLNHDFENEGIQVKADTEVEVSKKEDENKGLVKITILIWDNANKENYPFRLKISIIGQFSADCAMEENQFHEMCRYNGSAILLPFLRSAITDITKVANVTPLILPLINVQNLLDESD